MRRPAAILLGALLLAWPALLNRYPILFSDTHAFLIQAGDWRMIWDKPFAYGPFLRLLHQGVSLWGPLAGQVLLLSWLLARVTAAPPWRHVGLCAALALCTAAPWVADLLMPDIFAPITVLALYLLATEPRCSPAVLVLAAFAIASHLSHLVLAAACIAVLLLLTRRWRVTLPLLLALATLATSNLAFYQRLAISPYGAVFALARMTADGIIAPVLAAACPQSGWSLCAWQDRLPTDSDRFLWNADGPVWTHPGGAIGLAPEAQAIITQAIRTAPAAVSTAAIANTLRQLTRVSLGDTLGPDWLEGSVTNSLTQYFGPDELPRFRASRQAADSLAAWATPLNPLHAANLVLGSLATAWLAWRQRRTPAGTLALLILLALPANAFATGALSGPHDRYQARIAWLVLLPPLARWATRRNAAPPPPVPSAQPARIPSAAPR